jgi:uncharacterized membrane protein
MLLKLLSWLYSLLVYDLRMDPAKITLTLIGYR